MMLCFGLEILRDTYTGIPWQPGLKRGTALEAEGDRILVREEGFYYVYSQVRPFLKLSFHDFATGGYCQSVSKSSDIIFPLTNGAEKRVCSI